MICSALLISSPMFFSYSIFLPRLLPLLLTLLLLDSTLSAPPPPLPPSTTPRIDATAAALEQNLTFSTRCVHSPSWQAPAFLVEDCFAAVQQVYIKHVLRHPDEMFEFFRAGSYGNTKHPRVQTPVVIDVGTYDYYLPRRRRRCRESFWLGGGGGECEGLRFSVGSMGLDTLRLMICSFGALV